jgi:hypothetical protein
MVIKVSQYLSNSQLRALNNYFKYSVEKDIDLGFSRFTRLLEINNDFAIKALRYSSIDIACQIKNIHQVEVLQYYFQKDLDFDDSNSKYLFNIENHCQSSAIKLGFPLAIAAGVKDCLGAMNNDSYDAL